MRIVSKKEIGNYVRIDAEVVRDSPPIIFYIRKSVWDRAAVDEFENNPYPPSYRTVMQYADVAVNPVTNEVIKCRYSFDEMFDRLLGEIADE